MSPANLASLGMVIIFAGFLVVILGAFLGAFLGSGGSASAGGFILIGPIPIVFGTGPNSGTLGSIALALSAVLVAIYLVSFFIWGWERRREAEVRTDESGSVETLPS